MLLVDRLLSIFPPDDVIILMCAWLSTHTHSLLRGILIPAVMRSPPVVVAGVLQLLLLLSVGGWLCGWEESGSLYRCACTRVLSV